MWDTATDECVLFLELSGGGWVIEDFSEQTLLLRNHVSVSEASLWVVELKSRVMTPVSPFSEGQVAIRGALFSVDGSSVYLLTDYQSEFVRLMRVSFETPSVVECLSDQCVQHWEVERFDLSADGKLIVFTSNQQGLSAVHIVESATGAPVPQLGVARDAFPSGIIASLCWRHGSSTEIAFSLQNNRMCGDCFSFDLSSGRAVERWTFSESEIRTDDFVLPELFEWTGFDGLSLSGFLFLPPNIPPGTKVPCIVTIHGGPESQFRPTFLGRSNYLLQKLGCALLYPNIRGSTGFGKRFVTLDDGFKRTDSYDDIRTLLEALRTGRAATIIDVERIQVSGGSYGGHVVLASCYLFPRLFRCAVASVAMSNLVTFLENTESYRRDLRRVEYGDERDPLMREFLLRIAPMTNLSKFQNPLLLIAGANDPRVPLSETLQIASALKERNLERWLVIGNDEGHGFRKKVNQDAQFLITVAFIKQFLLYDTHTNKPNL